MGQPAIRPVINVKTAKALGLTLRLTMLGRADRVIEYSSRDTVIGGREVTLRVNSCRDG
jgi:hypothetical protein